MTKKYLDQFLTQTAAGKRPVVLFADIDGTLVDKSLQVSETDLEAIQRFIAAGFHFTLATGRGRINAEYHVQAVPSNFPAIFANGATLYDRTGRQSIIEHEMATEGLGELFRRLTVFYPEIMIQVYTPDQTYLVSQSPDEDPRVVEHHPFVRADFGDVEGQRCNKILFGLTDENCDAGMRLAHEYVREYLPQLRVVKSQTHYLELTPREVSKGKMIRYIRENSSAFVIAAGDYLNDIEMMREAELSYTLASSPAEVQEAADRVLDSRPGQFVARVIEDILSEWGNPAEAGK
ncbi:HAD-IIB family hydrolase [Proteiniclasticum sp. QWL-01]|uniref:HAD-IIB family hydrolase n=1 Tax=Proteiniclasticum sp. QWL-01 TaxID=3036945 RepID=UPI0024105FA3|nr:HAD-IIB family hydrolase [Proteiniclasticum sp. QWL-01]WFF72758.1 HAD-IIB family hydrolase [Proteiniclasticum sp. QWL-01]